MFGPEISTCSMSATKVAAFRQEMVKMFALTGQQEKWLGHPSVEQGSLAACSFCAFLNICSLTDHVSLLGEGSCWQTWRRGWQRSWRAMDPPAEGFADIASMLDAFQSVVLKRGFGSSEMRYVPVRSR